MPIRLSASPLLALFVLGWLSASASARADSNLEGEKLDLIPDKKELWNESMLWDKDITLRAGFGYKDNVLLAPSGAKGSGFFTSGLELSIFRLPLDGHEFNLTVIGDDVRYWRNLEINGEDAWLATAQYQRYLAAHWRLGLEVKGTYVDQVLESLLETGGVRAIEAKGESVGVRPFVRRDLGTNWWVMLDVPISREWWGTPLDNVWKYGGEIALGRSYGFHSEVALKYGAFYIPHDEWEAEDAGGIAIAGQKLKLWRQEAELKWLHTWDAKQRWRSVTRAGFQYDQDNGGGFFNYYRYLLSEELRWRSADWEIKGAVSVSYFDFPVQTITMPPSPTLHLTTLDLTLRLERRLCKELRIFAAFEHEQALSNDPTSEYKVNVATGGLSFEF